MWFWPPDAEVKSCGTIRTAMGARKPGPQEEHDISVKTIAQGRPGCLGQTCGNRRVLFLMHAGHGRGQRPAFPAPSVSKGGTLQASTRVKPTARTRSHVTRVEFDVPVPRHRRCHGAHDGRIAEARAASNITFRAGCWTTAISAPSEAKARWGWSRDTSRKVAIFGMPGIASASCRILSCTHPASELDVRGIPSIIERLRSGLKPFGKAFRSLAVHGIHHSFTINLFRILKYRIVSAVPRPARFTLSGNGRRVSEPKRFKP